MRPCLFAVLLMLAAGPVHAHPDEGLRLQEQAIKAGLLYNFLKYIKWPSHEAGPAVILCIYGDNPFGDYLQPMTRRTVNRRPIAVREIHDLQDVASCQLVFINADEKAHWPELHKFLDGRDILTVSDFSSFAASGGMIEFGRKNNHISVQLNIDSVDAARLHVEDRLLNLVTVVHSGEPY